MTRVGTLSDAVATIVRNYTEETYVSQSELARRSGISQPHISNVFNGKTVFTLDQLDRVCDALGLQLISVIHEADVITRRD
ncbi:helix-turn-helix domain-containing protein [Agromyces lapidis]|uniref:Helix-turn-helix domain-containing protein n=1 Tax=Agromyces lapidis TaxID=279574 RepID=A0ABV5SMD2_9MICO|nr:helix-turn-helix transcriptional regulator [Agromyces lapidis]